jgi:hypothetical protein
LIFDVGSRTTRDLGMWQRYGELGGGVAVTALTVSGYDSIATFGVRGYARVGWAHGDDDVRPLVAITGDTQVRLDHWEGESSTAGGDLTWTFRPAWAGIRLHAGVRF